MTCFDFCFISQNVLSNHNNRLLLVPWSSIGMTVLTVTSKFTMFGLGRELVCFDCYSKRSNSIECTIM